MSRTSTSPPPSRPTAGRGGATGGRAVLDDAHVGDIRGALGSISRHDLPPRRPWRRRILALLAIMGPGLIVMVGDNDAGGVATYAQAGQNYGTTLLWTLLLLVPVLIVSQEMVVRLGAVTGVGHGRLIKERFGTFWAAFSIIDLFLLDFLTIVTEFIGVDLALGYFGISRYISVPLAGVGLVAMTATGSFQRWERIMYVLIAGNLLVFPMLLLAHPQAGPTLHGLLVPGARGGFTATTTLLIIAIVGTTIAPWQLFFQQSNIVDKRITPRWINYERFDTVVGAVLTNVGAAAILLTAAFAFRGTHFFGQFANAGATAQQLGHAAGHGLAAVFALVLLDASILGAAAVTLSTSYALGDIFGAKHSLHRSWRDAKGFYAVFAAITVGAMAIVLIPHAPLGLITTGVQALAGVLLPSAIVFLLLLCNDRDVLGPWVNAPWLNLVSALIVGVLVVLSLVLTATTLFSRLQPAPFLLGASVVLGIGLVVGVVMTVRSTVRGAAQRRAERLTRAMWTMPALALLGRPAWSPVKKGAMYLLRGYLLVSVVMLVVKTVELAAPH